MIINALHTPEQGWADFLFKKNSTLFCSEEGFLFSVHEFQGGHRESTSVRQNRRGCWCYSCHCIVWEFRHRTDRGQHCSVANQAKAAGPHLCKNSAIQEH